MSAVGGERGRLTRALHFSAGPPRLWNSPPVLELVLKPQPLKHP